MNPFWESLRILQMLVLTHPRLQLPRHPPPRAVRRSVPPRSALDPVEFTGKAIGLWVFFTTATNWWFYRRIRKEAEKDKK